jgi:hypothetical protein
MKRGFVSVGVLVAGLVALSGVAPTSARGSSAGYLVIVSASNPASWLSRAEVASCYLGERRQWPDGGVVVVLDQSLKSPVRAAFSQEVLGQSVDAVQSHWMKLITTGRGRPPLTATEEEIVSLVAKERRMVGYVSAELTLPPSVKAVPVRD